MKNAIIKMITEKRSFQKNYFKKTIDLLQKRMYDSSIFKKIPIFFKNI